MSSAKSVAKELVRLSHEGSLPDPLTFYRLNCLVYYAQGWSLVLRDSEIFPDDIECLQEGPSVPAIRGAMGDRLIWHCVPRELFSQEPNLDQKDEAVFLHYLWMAYAGLSPSGLYASIQEDPVFLQGRKNRENGGDGLVNVDSLRESLTRRPGMPWALGEYDHLRKEMVKQAELAILNSLPLDVDTIWKDCKSQTPSASKR